jgi:hypothetical protein
MSPIVMEPSYIFHLYFSFEKPNSGKIIILTSQLFGFYFQILTNYFFPHLIANLWFLVSKHTFKGP